MTCSQNYRLAINMWSIVLVINECVCLQELLMFVAQDELMTLHYGVLPNKNYFLQDVDDYEDDYEDEVDPSDDDYI